jgi:hypothetical protein
VPNRVLEFIDPMGRAIRPKAAKAAIGLQANLGPDNGLLADAHAGRPCASGRPYRPDVGDLGGRSFPEAC